MLSTPFEVKNKISGSEGIAVSEHFSIEFSGELDNQGQPVKIPVHWFTVLYFDQESPMMTLAQELEWLSVPGITDDDDDDNESGEESEDDESGEESENGELSEETEDGEYEQ